MAAAQDIDQLAEMILRTCEREEVSLFVGAGISIEAPASMPSTNDLKWQILEALAGQKAPDQYRPLLQEYLNAHMLELLLQDLKESIGAGALDILDVFHGGEPNLYHHLIAKLARQKLIQRVITTNFDCLIESALAEEGVEYTVLSTEHDFGECVVNPESYQAFNVIKLHGTIAFMERGCEISGRRDVKAISPLKLEARKLLRELKKHGVKTAEYGLERTVSAKQTLVGSLDFLGLHLSEVTTELLRKHLQNSTVIVIGWNGFDLDISPLVVEHAKAVHWIVHAPPSDGRQAPEGAGKLDGAQEAFQEGGLDETREGMMALATSPDFSLDVLPTPEKERAQLLKRVPESTECKVFTPLLIRRLWSRLTGDSDNPRSREGTLRTATRDIRLVIQRWSESIPPYLPLRWGLGKFLLGHGEYDAAQPTLQEVIDAVAAEGLHDVAAMLHLDLGELNAIYGKRAEAERAYVEAIRLYQEQTESRREPSGIVAPFHLQQLVERAYFGLGELACEFYDFAAAARAFSQMPTDTDIVQALVHYCREDFQKAKRLLDSKIQLVRLGGGRFHHYLSYFLKLIDARMHWMCERMDMAADEFYEVLTAATKVGLPRLQVQALNGLAMTYSSHVSGRVYSGGRRIDSAGPVDPYYDNLQAAKFAAQSIAIANQAEYRYGRAHAGYYMGIIYAGVGLRDVATSALRYSEGLFAKLGHAVGLDFCRHAKANHHLAWESVALSQTPQRRNAEARIQQPTLGSHSGSSIRGEKRTDGSPDVGPDIGGGGEDQRVDVCWLDFWGASPSGLDGLLRDAGFQQLEVTAGLQVWRAAEFPEVLLEVLNVNSYPREPVSKVPGLTAEQVDEDRRRTCVPLGMDPYYRCMLYAPDRTRPTEVLFDQLSEARNRLYSRFVDIASFPGANVQAEWALWRRKPLPPRPA